jgi:hypothetical protein
MSPRQKDTTLAETSESAEGQSKSRGLPSSQRNSRRSDSAMSNARTRGSASKDESETDQQGATEESTSIKDETVTAEPEEDEDDNAASGDSIVSTAQTTTRGRRKPGGKRRRGGGAAASSRSRPSRGAVAVEAEEEETAVKSEVDDEAAETKEAGDAGAESEEAGEDGKPARHHRSASGFKELAGLGLKSLGDGDGEPLVPRRTRRGAASPNEGGPQHKEENDEDSHEEEAGAEDAKLPLEEQSIKEGPASQGEDETAEEGVTRCLCGSAGEFVERALAESNSLNILCLFSRQMKMSAS